MPFSRLKASVPLWQSGVRGFCRGMRTWHFQLMAWNTGVVLLTVFISMAAVREGLRLMMLYETEQLLADDSAEIRQAFRQYYPDLDAIRATMDREAQGHAHRGLFMQLLSADNQVLFSSVHTPPADDLSPMHRGKVRPIPSGGYSWQDHVVDLPNAPRYTLRVGSNLERARHRVRRVSQLMLAVGAVLSLLAPMGGYWLANRATIPLQQIIQTAERLRPAQMQERLPNRGSQDELDRLSGTINALLDRIADYLGRHREFVANAAHELRSPLTAIQSSVDVALNSERSAAEYQELLHNVREECSGLSKLVNQLLLLAESDGETHNSVRQPVDLDYLVQKAADMFRGIAEEQGIALNVSPPRSALVLGDASRVRQVINNLLENALKFTPPGGRVQVSVTTDAAVGQVRCTVADNGPGIAPADLPHVFERFFQGNKSRTRQSQSRGAGLGLSICQAIVAAHSGKIEVESLPGAGTTFTVSLPLQRGNAGGEGALAAAEAPGEFSLTGATQA